MLTVDDYGRIRRAHRDGMSIREIARRFHHSRQKVREVLRGAGRPQSYPERQRQSAPKLGPFHDLILQILAEDKSAPPKQRHTAVRIFERLRDEHAYAGGYDAVRRFVKKHRIDHRETFIPLDHEPGQRLEADFGKIYVELPNGRRQVSILILVWSYSNAPFAVALPTERTEAILEGMVQAFEFFGCIPREVWWDNPKTVATALLRGRDRKVNRDYAALASHYVFEPLFCMPASGNEKPVVENRVKTLQRRWSTPVPRVKDLDELNTYLRACCRKDRSCRSRDAQKTIEEQFGLDHQNAAELPRHQFDACIRKPAKVDKYQFARFENVCYSVPRSYAFQTVTVKGYVDRVDIVQHNQVVATHVRSYESGDQVLDPLHYLVALSRRPAALDHSNVYRDWKLPAVFGELRSRLEDRHGSRAGVRQFVRVLELLREHPAPRVSQAIEQLRGPEGADADRIIRRVHETAARQQKSHRAELDGLVRDDVTQVSVPSPGLAHFDSFLTFAPSPEGSPSQENSHDKTQRPAAAQSEPQTTSVADDRSGVRETGPRSDGVKSDVRTVPAATDGAGSRDQTVERADDENSPGGLSRGEGLGELRLLRDRSCEQAEGLGVGAVRMDHTAVQRLPAGSAGNGQNASGCRTGELGGPSWLSSAFLHRGGVGESSRRETEAVSARSFFESTGPHGPADLR
jgi:transposase